MLEHKREGQLAAALGVPALVSADDTPCRF